MPFVNAGVPQFEEALQHHPSLLVGTDLADLTKGINAGNVNDLTDAWNT